MKNLLFIILILLQLSCWDSLSTMHDDLTMKVPVCVHFNKGNDSNDGRGWKNAKQTINGAIATAQSGDEIWVAGTLTVTAANTINSSGKTLTFYGGFDGNESRRDQRDYVNKKTVLNGTYNLLSFNNISCDYAFDGFTFENGGSSSTPSVFIYNSKYITIRNSLFSGGYAVGCTGGEVVFEDCRFVNIKSLDSVAGGALSLNSNSIAEIKNCVFTGNKTYTAGYNGGAIFCSSGTLTITNCNFMNNYTTGGNGGAIYCNSSSTIDIVNSIFKNNHADGSYYGGAICCANSKIKVSGCLFNGNTANTCGAIFNGTPTVPTEHNDLEITDTVFDNNTSSTGNGGAIHSYYSKLVICNSVFNGNTTNSLGGAIFINEKDSIGSLYIFLNSLFYNNYAGSFGGGAIYSNATADMYFINCTFFQNTSSTGTGCFLISGSSPSFIYNSVFYSNSGSYSIDGGTAYCYNNAWDKGENCTGDPVNTQVLDSSPFMSTDSGSGMFLRISAASSCVNTGTNTVPGFTLPETDLGGFPRIVDGTVDIGAYEYQ